MRRMGHRAAAAPATQAIEAPARQALRAAARALDCAQSTGEPCAMSEALTTMARCCRDLDECASAEAYLGMALRWSRLAGSTDLVVELLCELAETAVGLAEAGERRCCGGGHEAHERAREHAFEATINAGRTADAGREAHVLLRISDVLDRCGDRDDAVQLQTRALRLMSGGVSAGAPDPSLLPSIGRLADS
jgi:hypothetical protein